MAIENNHRSERCEVPAAKMTVELVELLGAESRAMTLTEIAHGLKANSPMVLRLLRVLEAEGWVRRVGKKGPYRLTPRPLQFFVHAVGTDHLASIASPILKKVAQKTNCIAVVSVPSCDTAVCLAFASPNEAVGVSTRIGGSYPYHASAPGKILMAYSSDAPRDEILQNRLRRYTQNTLTTPEALSNELDVVRRNGYAVDNEEAYRGILCLNVPLFNHQKECVATLGISTLAFYCNIDELVENFRDPLLAAGKKISEELGCTGEYPVVF